ncbi:cache domain-containing protein [Clostridium tagluense]|uniref:cache domain-containing protein n=1 Tax=Clostridium tagluense TaxID=360422 RepID=UPI001CF5034F|nr:cache domain-containing protein [Clostridium tagluense]MCB2313095.1 cache domain-containing protein [Clostridium tagluense]MCB2317861.1 cache domain-containing protein [Clostridium tagluense]MCB2322646.1 cache domain-containing protein [Clostridium tagluense]MCB2327700.1 cache domain-containing protein [Clostridium tagluense]MCB2332291.1 cache domain-containing protein [Clostridium tagluense]
MKGLKFIISILLVFSFSGCGVNVNPHASNNTTDNAANVDTTNINKTSINIENVKKELEVLEKDLGDDNKKEVILKHLNKFKEKSELKTAFIYFGDERGNFYTTPIVELPGDYDPRSRDWYTNAKENGEYVSDIYIDASNNNKILTVSKGIYKNKKLIGVIAIDLVVENNENK